MSSTAEIYKEIKNIIIYMYKLSFMLYDNGAQISSYNLIIITKEKG